MNRISQLILAAALVMSAGCRDRPAPDVSGAVGPIVFSAPDENGRFQLYSTSVDGTGRRQHTAAGNNVTPSWTPDGKRIVFASDQDGAREIYFMNQDGTGRTRLATAAPGDKLAPNLSHDGSRIAFASFDPKTGRPEIWMADADGSRPRRLTETPTAAGHPTWSMFPRFSPDDRAILYASTRGGSPQIWIMNADGSGPRQLTRGFGPDFPDANAPNWSPDGKRIAFWAGHETRYGDVWVMNADGSDARRLTSEPAPISSDNPAWSQDGERIIFDTSRGRHGAEIWIMRADGSGQMKLISDCGSRGVMQMSWRPARRHDGRSRRPGPAAAGTSRRRA